MSSKLAAVHALVRDDYELISQLGRAHDGSEAYLARERTSGNLVALRVDNQVVEKGSAAITITRTLDANLPAHARYCPNCQTKIDDWRRYCMMCRVDLSGSAVPPAQIGSVLDAAIRASDQPLDMLGQMPTTDGGGAVYFGTARSSGQIVAFNFRENHKEAGDSGRFSIHITSTLTRLEPGSLAWAGPQAPVEESAAFKVCPSCGREYNPNTRFCPDDGSVLRASGASESLVGEVIADRYHILSKIGQGGMGQVYLAEHVRIGRRCAIKVLNRSLTNDVDAVNRFSREAANAARINDENVADIYDFGESKEHGIYLAMEYVAGEPLSRILAREAPLTVTRTLMIAAQVARGLWAAHRRGIVHRDLTPNNIVIGQSDEGETVKIVDFGIAKALQDSSSHVTKTGFVVGTPQYMSPEQLIGDHVDARSDIYQLGCILFEMLTCARPFANADGSELVTRRLVEPPPHPRDRIASIPSGVDELVVKALAMKREDRFESAIALRTAIDELLWELSGAADVAGTDPRRGVISGPRRADTPPRMFRQPVTPPAQPSHTAPSSGQDAAANTPATPAVTPASPSAVPTPASRTPRPTPKVSYPADQTAPVVTASASWSQRFAGMPLVVRAAAVAVLLGGAALAFATAIIPDDPEPELSTPEVAPPPVAPAPDPVPPPQAVKASDVGQTPVDPARNQRAAGATGAVGTSGATAVAEGPAPRPNRGSLVLSGELPADAVVQLDGSPTSNRNAPVSLSPGLHHLRITAQGFETVQDSVRIEPGATFTYRFSLRQLPVVEAAAPTPRPQAEQPTTPPDPGKAREDIRASLLAFVSALNAGGADQLRAAFPGATDAQIADLAKLRGTRSVTLDPNYAPPTTINPAGTDTFFNLFFRDGNIALPLPYRARLAFENGRWVLTQFLRR